MSTITVAGRHTVQFQLRGQRIHRRCPEGTTKAEAQALEVKLRRAIFATRDLGVEADVPLAGAIEIWLKEWVKGSKSAKSREEHALALADVVGERTLRELVDAADEYRQTTGLAPATINRRLAVLKSVAKWSWQHKRWIGENLSPRVWMLPENNARHRYLTAAEARRLIQAMPTAAGKAWVALAVYTGLRQGELHGLERRQINRGLIYLGKSKTGLPRLVPIAKPGLRYVKAVPFKRTVDSLDWEYRNARDAAGFEDLHFHDLRHTYASFLVNQDVDLYVVGQLLGHSATQTTKRYAHLYERTLKRAVAKVK